MSLTLVALIGILLGVILVVLSCSGKDAFEAELESEPILSKSSKPRRRKAVVHHPRRKAA